MSQSNAFAGVPYVYANRRGYPDIAYTKAMYFGVPRDNYFVDNAGEDKQLRYLFQELNEGDVVIIGTITDLMLPEIGDMLDNLEHFNELGVQVISALQPDYNIKEYRQVIRLADIISRVRLGQKPV